MITKCTSSSIQRARSAEKKFPRLEASNAANDEVCMDLPEYDLRKAMCASDPLSVIEGYKIEIYLRLATLCGLRMCPDCPSCNVKGIGCQDKFGSNMRPGGGIFGAAVALGAGTEHQGYGTPHLHGEIHVNSIFQYHSEGEL